MLFKPEHKPMILADTKTATRRCWKRTMVKVGNIYKAKTQMLSKEYFAEIKITRLYKQKLGEMTAEDAWKEGYNTLAEFHQIWIKINGKYDSNLLVDVIEFQRLPFQLPIGMKEPESNKENREAL